MAQANFKQHPIEYFTGEGRGGALSHLFAYKKKTGFHFDQLARPSDPNVVTAQDIIAVSMLSVDVPANASLWLLMDGAATVTGLLEGIDRRKAIWDDDVDISKGSKAWDLWNAVDDLSGMGATKTSKLLAAKRPHLLPVIDDVVRRALFHGSRRDVEREYWDLWRAELRGDGGSELRAAVESVRREAGYDESTSVLRIIDIVVWSANRTS